jgi:hypothetical protein
VLHMVTSVGDVRNITSVDAARAIVRPGSTRALRNANNYDYFAETP